jgi:hypothetical protein
VGEITADEAAQSVDSADLEIVPPDTRPVLKDDIS